MLEELHVRDLALIEEVWLEFGPGMTVISGETGAGKTAVIGALQLLVGERADSGAVRAGAAEALVEGRFSAHGSETVAKRRVSADGRSRCTLDGEMATVGGLAEALGPQVDLHGQHEHQALFSASTHSGYLDRMAGAAASEALGAYRAARSEHREATAALEGLAERLAEAARNADYLRFMSDEIGKVAPQPGEDEELEARLPALIHAEKLAQAAGEAARLLRGDGGALDAIAGAAEALSKSEGIDTALDAHSARLKEAAALLDDAGLELRAYAESVDRDPAELDAVSDRLGQLHGLMRKYGPRLEDVIGTADTARAELAECDEGEEAIGRARERVERAKEALQVAGQRLRDVRGEAVPQFVAALGAAVAELSMPGASFEVAVTELPFDLWTADGPDRIEFLYSPAPGQPARPLTRIASGGEISRVMLALKGVLGEADTVGTLVFDEVDAGVGGATAHAVGKRLASLARTHQVIVVTHLAQVAAYADRQLVVEKTVTGEVVATSVRSVEGEQRVAEIARMLSGNDSEASLAHARELLEEAATPR